MDERSALITACRALLVQRILQLLARAKSRLLRRLDLNLRTRLRIAAFAALSLRDGENAKPRESHFIAGLEGVGDGVENAVHRFVGIMLGEARSIRKLLDQVVLVADPRRRRN